jgi:anaerobic selenocysteine-containing dehydrogenase
MEYQPVRFEKYRSKPLMTPSGKFEFSSRYLADLGHPALPVYEPPYYLRNRTEIDAQERRYVLITGARKRVYLHSRYRNIPRFRRRHPRSEIELHPADAAALGAADGDPIRVGSEVGSIVLPAKILASEAILPGLVQITHGWGGESNVNRLTFDTITDPISGFPLLTSIPVRLERVWTMRVGSQDETPEGEPG